MAKSSGLMRSKESWIVATSAWPMQAWGYVDHPPLSVGILWLIRATLGDSLMALRLLPALAGCVTVVLVGLMARDLGGGAR